MLKNKKMKRKKFDRELEDKPVKFPKRQAKGDYKEPDYPVGIVPEIY